MELLAPFAVRDFSIPRNEFHFVPPVYEKGAQGSREGDRGLEFLSGGRVYPVEEVVEDDAHFEILLKAILGDEQLRGFGGKLPVDEARIIPVLVFSESVQVSAQSGSVDLIFDFGGHVLEEMRIEPHDAGVHENCLRLQEQIPLPKQLQGIGCGDLYPVKGVLASPLDEVFVEEGNG